MQDHFCQELNCQHKCWRAHKEEICPASEWASFSQCCAFFSPIAPLNNICHPSSSSSRSQPSFLQLSPPGFPSLATKTLHLPPG